MSQQRRKQRPQAQPASKTRVTDVSPAATPDLAGAGNSIPDEHGYLAIGLAIGGMAFVIFLTMMILVAAN